MSHQLLFYNSKIYKVFPTNFTSIMKQIWKFEVLN